MLLGFGLRGLGFQLLGFWGGLEFGVLVASLNPKP